MSGRKRRKSPCVSPVMNLSLIHIYVDADDEEYGLVIMKAIVENGEELLSTPDSDEELDTVYNLFMERFFEEEDEE